MFSIEGSSITHPDEGVCLQVWYNFLVVIQSPCLWFIRYIQIIEGFSIQIPSIEVHKALFLVEHSFPTVNRYYFQIDTKPKG